MLKRTTEISDYSISEKTSSTHKDKVSSGGQCVTQVFFIPTHRALYNKTFYIHFSNISFFGFIVLYFKNIISCGILNAFISSFFFWVLLKVFFGSFKEDFLGSGSVMGRLYIGAVLAVYLEQGVVVVATKSSSHDFFYFVILNNKNIYKITVFVWLSYTFSHPPQYNSQTTH